MSVTYNQLTRLIADKILSIYLLFYDLFDDGTSNPEYKYVMSNDYIIVNYELHVTWKDMVIAWITSSIPALRWAGNLARMGEKTNVYKALVGSQKERDH
jgi:hypothetical protein